MQWEDDRGTWHTYGYNDCRQLEGAFLAGETETALTSGASRAAVTVNLGSSHEIRSHIAHLTPGSPVKCAIGPLLSLGQVSLVA